MSYYATLTVDNTKVGGSSGSLSNFPVLVSGTYAGADDKPDLRSTSNGGDVENANGYDILFYNDASKTTKYDHELQYYNATTGQIVAWVRIPTLNKGSDTTFYMHYGDSSIVNDPSTNTTWNSNFQLVAHLDEAVNTDAGGYEDSSQSGFDGTGVSMSEAAVDKIHKAQSFDGSADYIKFGDNLDKSPTSAFTLGLWINPDTDATTTILMAKQDVEAGTYRGYRIYRNTSNYIYAGLIGYAGATLHQAEVGATSNAVLKDGWTHVIATFDGSHSAAGIKIYLNGSSKSTATAADTLLETDDMNAAAELTLAARDVANLPMNCQIDEAFVLGVEADSEWITTWYNTQADPSTFYSVGDETSSGSPSVLRVNIGQTGYGVRIV